MCIIALKPENTFITDKTIEQMWENNSDGAGFMYADRGNVVIVKGLMSLTAFMNEYRKVQRRKLVMHFRIRTHGPVSPRLTHPFWITKGGLAMVHNGIISSYSNATLAGESDTSMYARALSKRYENPLDSICDPLEYERIVKEIGYSKLVFMNGDGETQIVNEKMGHWHNGCWFSNYGYEPYKYSYSSFTSYKTVGATSGDDDWDYSEWLPKGWNRSVD
jgi:predicted glutamine amidotransferase